MKKENDVKVGAKGGIIKKIRKEKGENNKYQCYGFVKHKAKSMDGGIKSFEPSSIHQS